MRKPPTDIIASAQASQAKWGIPACISLAQWAVESGWGRSMPAGSNNPFGIKALPGQPYVTAKTREERGDGSEYYIPGKFRKYASLEEAFDDHGRLLATGRPYAAARAKLPDPDAFADALTGVYATDHTYGTTLKSIMKSNDLYQYNGVKAGMAGTAGTAAAPVVTSADPESAAVEALNEAQLRRTR